MEGRFAGIERIQVRYESLKTLVGSIFEQVPLKASFLIPFGPLAEFIARCKALIKSQSTEL